MPHDRAQRLTERFPEIVSTDPDDLATYGRDWTRVYEPAPCAVALPRSTDDVAALLRFCDDEGIPVVPSGGRTGLAAGAVAKDGELVLSLSRMRRMDPVDLSGLTVRVQAGAVTEAVHQHCAEHGLTWPVDFASKGSSQVGGNIATNAGGVRVIRHGLTRQWVLGLQVVTARGEVLELNGALEKNNTGTDLRQLFIGSEGTLGVITEATLKLAKLPARVDVALLAVRDIAAVLALSARAARQATRRDLPLPACRPPPPFDTGRAMPRADTGARRRGLSGSDADDSRELAFAREAPRSHSWPRAARPRGQRRQGPAERRRRRRGRGRGAGGPRHRGVEDGPAAGPEAHRRADAPR